MNNSETNTKIENCITFKDYNFLSKNSKNKVGFLMECFKRLHSDAPEEDFDNLNGKMARIWILLRRDTGYAIKVIWDTCSANIVGSHINYILAIVNKNKKQVGVASKAGINNEHKNKLERLSELARSE